MRLLRRTWWVLSACLAALILAATAINGSASAHNPTYRCYVNEDWYRVYDYRSYDPNGGSAQYDDPNNVDFPINLYFTNNAEVDKVKIYSSDLSDYDSVAASTKWARLNDDDPADPETDSDAGRKTIGATWDEHFRIYADEPDDHLYTTGWGFYCIATSHRDYMELVPGATRYGWSEDAEQMICDDFASINPYWGLSVTRNWKNLSNYENNHWVNDRYYQNSGWASKVRFPDSPEYVGHQ